MHNRESDLTDRFDRYGYWGICFLYGTFFVLSGLVSVEKTYDNSEAIRKAVQFFLSTQNEEGGWGESLESCPSEVISQTKLYVTITINFNGSKQHTNKIFFFLSRKLCLMLLQFYLTHSDVCLKQKFTPLDGNKTNLVQTSWAMLGLMYGGQVSIH